MTLSQSSLREDAVDVAFALVVDDDREMAEEVRETLALPQSSIMIASNLAEALMIIEDHPTIELIITDYYLVTDQNSHTNGEQLIDCLTCRYPRRKFDFIVISGDPYCFNNLRERTTVTCHAKPLISDLLVETLAIKKIPTRYAISVLKSRTVGSLSKRSNAVVTVS